MREAFEDHTADDAAEDWARDRAPVPVSSADAARARELADWLDGAAGGAREGEGQLVAWLREAAALLRRYPAPLDRAALAEALCRTFAARGDFTTRAFGHSVTKEPCDYCYEITDALLAALRGQAAGRGAGETR